ncbi:MAG: hypothetical protein FWE21_07145 [Defluviitaleaceae bacterium]|nr:hypothetical protein [Defluviitaleaceae bacterium]
MSALSIIQLFIPIITFSMGYFLTNIGYKRDRRLAIVREKFEKLYHPFYLLMIQLGTDAADGESVEIGGDSYDSIKPFFDHLMANIYLASKEGQELFLKTRKLFVQCCNATDEEREREFQQLLGTLFEYLTQGYLETAKTLGYEIDTKT